MESNWEFYKDSEDEEVKIGVELVPLERILTDNRVNKLHYRKLVCERDNDFNEKLIKAESITHNRPYDIILTDWIKALFQLHIGNVRRKRAFWCSALVAFMHVKLGKLSETVDWTIVSPKQLGTENKNKNLKFINCVMKDEVELEY